jgi:hypothetical protein
MKIGSVRSAQTRVTLYQSALYSPNIPENLNLAKAGWYLLVPTRLFFVEFACKDRRNNDCGISGT